MLQDIYQTGGQWTVTEAHFEERKEEDCVNAFLKKALQSVSIVFFLFSKHKSCNFRIIINLICVHCAKALYKFELEDISQETDIH